MIESGLTLASLTGALAYLGTVALAVMAGRAARHSGNPAAWHWWLLAALFFALACWRLGMGELRLQDDVRAWAQSRGLYESRHTLQALLTLSLLASAGVTIAVISTWRLSRSMLALGSGGALVLFTFVRFVSLHQLDSLLFRTGPIHLNYLIDLGLTGCAATFCWREFAARDAPPVDRRSSRRAPS